MKSIFVSVGLCVTPGVNIEKKGGDEIKFYNWVSVLPQLGGEINFVSVGLYVTPGVNIDGGG